jgi:hypothetical protein
VDVTRDYALVAVDNTDGDFVNAPEGHTYSTKTNNGTSVPHGEAIFRTLSQKGTTGGYLRNRPVRPRRARAKRVGLAELFGASYRGKTEITAKHFRGPGPLAEGIRPNWDSFVPGPNITVACTAGWTLRIFFEFCKPGSCP